VICAHTQVDLIALLHVPGILRRLGISRKINLSPETSSLAGMIELVKVLQGDGLRIFSLAFHSPSLAPGNTPYVKSQRELEEFLARCRGFFDWFIDEFAGVPAQPLELKERLLRSNSLMTAPVAADESSMAAG